jgi:catechol 2,3-dioxygenase-like lactoylglutathione lyase family enzyme
MLTNVTVIPTLPAVVLDRAQRFYQDVLGLPLMHQEDALLVFRIGSSDIHLYKSEVPPGPSTVVSLIVENYDAAVSELRDRGIRFEAYGLPDLENHVGQRRSQVRRSAWFKDSEGNVLKIEERGTSGT